MAAYVISEVEIIDPALADRYRPLAAESIAQFGGHYIVRGGKATLVEGEPPPKMLIIVEFPTMARAKEWYRSPEYAAALEFRRERTEPAVAVRRRRPAGLISLRTRRKRAYV